MSPQTGATRIRIEPQAGGGAIVRMLMTHPMENGRQRDGTGQSVPAWYIKQVRARHNDRVVLTAQWGPSVSKNPFLQFRLRAVRPGDRITIDWTDNRGESRVDAVVVP